MTRSRTVRRYKGRHLQKRRPRPRLGLRCTVLISAAAIVLLAACRTIHTPDTAADIAVYAPVSSPAPTTLIYKTIRQPAAMVEDDTDTVDEMESYTAEETPSPYLLLSEVPLSDDLQTATQAVCEKYGVPYALALAVIETESAFDPDADNGLCIGLMQINSVNFSWLSELGIDPHTYEGNVEAGVLILSRHMETYGDWHKALMAYNCGASGAANLWAQGYTSSGYSRSVIAKAETWQTIIDENAN